jgi:hypothetical protein
MTGARAAIERAQHMHVTAAWLAASLARAKKIPALDKLIREPRRTEAAPHWEVQLAQWQAYADRKGAIQ